MPAPDNFPKIGNAASRILKPRERALGASMQVPNSYKKLSRPAFQRLARSLLDLAVAYGKLIYLFNGVFLEQRWSQHQDGFNNTLALSSQKGV